MHLRKQSAFNPQFTSSGRKVLGQWHTGRLCTAVSFVLLGLSRRLRPSCGAKIRCVSVAFQVTSDGRLTRTCAASSRWLSQIDAYNSEYLMQLSS